MSVVYTTLTLFLILLLMFFGLFDARSVLAAGCCSVSMSVCVYGYGEF